MSFQNKTIWITGASSGIGEALAIEFCKQGANVILSARRENELKRVAELCEIAGAKVRILPLDLTQPQTFEAIVEAAFSSFAHIDMLVNNGGISQRSTVLESNMEMIRRIMEVNFFGAVALTKTVLPHMIQQGSGHIVVVSSVMGKIGTKYRSAYAASKHALQGWFDCLRQEMYEHRIDVSLVCPGYVKTNITLNSLTGDGSTFGKMGDAHQKAITPEQFSKKLLSKLNRKQDEIYIGGTEVYAVYLKRFFPRLLNRILRNVKVI